MVKKNIFGIIIVILIAGAFAAGYLLGKRATPQRSAFNQRMAMMDGQPQTNQQTSTGQTRPATGQQPPAETPEQSRSTTGQAPTGERGDTEQRPAMMPGGNPGDGQSGRGGQGMPEELRAMLMKAREEGKNREEIQAMMAKFREQQSSAQPQAMTPDQPPAEEQQPQAQHQRPDREQETAASTSNPPTYEFYGTAAPSAEVNVQSKQGGTIIMLKGKEGDTVRKGEVLVRFDDSEQRLNLQKALSSKNSTLQQVRQAENNLKAAQTDFERNQELFNQGLVSQQNMDNLRNKLESARSSLNSANENVKQADTQIALQEKALEDFVVRSPISGIIDLKKYNLQEIYKGSDVIYHIVNIDQVYVNVDVPETYIKQIREGMKVTVTFNALGDQRFPGVVETILSSGATANRNFTVKVLVNNPEHAIKPGMFASVEIAYAG